LDRAFPLPGKAFCHSYGIVIVIHFFGKDLIMFNSRYLWKGLLFFLPVVFFNHLIVPAVSSAQDNIPRITVQELKAKMDKGEDLVVVDVRTGNDYEASKIKIKGAVRISIVKIEERYKDLSKDKEIITYCT
jgi:hypothetical protein